MKVAITSTGKDLASPVDSRFGRAQYFIIVDTETDSYTVMDNSQNVNAMQGAGIQAAKNVSDAGARAVVTGNVGPKAFNTLNSAGVEIYTGASGTVQDALDAFKAGSLKSAGKANVQGKWL